MRSLDHLGIATDDAEALSTLFEALLGGRCYHTEAVEEQGVTAHFLPAALPEAEAPSLELLEPTDADATVARFLESRGPGMHHLAVRVPSVKKAMDQASQLDVRLLSEEPRTGAHGKQIAFLHPKDTGGVLVELCEHTDPLPPATRIPFAYDGTRGALAAYAFGSADNPPLLLLHGAAGCTHLETLPLAHRLAPYFHVLALDFPGHGGSAPFGDAPFTPTLFAESARATLDHFEKDSSNVFGFSMGGNMTLHLAQRHPERIQRLAVHGACLSWPAARAERMAARLDIDIIRKHNGPAAATLQAAHADWASLFARTERFVRTLPDRTDQMHEMAECVDASVLVSASDHDELFPLEVPLELHRRLPNARLAVLPGRRHALGQTDLGPLLPPLTQHLLPDGQG